jgi:hypothetical protein
VNKSCQFNFQNVGFITCPYFQSNNLPPFIPLCKSVTNPTLYCSGSFDLTDIFYNYPPNVYIYLYPTYKMNIYDVYATLIYTLDNTNGNDILYSNLVNSLVNVKSIILYCNNFPIL